MSVQDTSIAGGEMHFPSTVWEDLCKAGDRRAPGFREALNRLAATYWRPVYHYIRVAWNKPIEDAKDLTQEFFTAIFDPEFVAQSDPERGSFRAFVITSLRNFLSNEEKARHALKRGGAVLTISLDLPTDDGDGPLKPIAAGESPEQYFDRAWAHSVLEQATAQLKQRFQSQGKPKVFEAFRLYCLEGESVTSYRGIASELGISTKEVDNYIYTARKEFRSAVSDVIRQSVSDPNLVADELRRLFGT